MVSLKSPYFLALDIDDPAKALQLSQQVANYVGGIKIGPRLAFKGGAELIKKIAALSPIFLDFKFYDIPSTMEASVRACVDLGVTYVTVHASAGLSALEKLAELERKISSDRPFQILAVTILTSFSQKDLPSFLSGIPIEEQVSQLASLVVKSGLTGLVCSPHEVQKLRRAYPESYLVTPGVRLETDALDDQMRTMTPLQALEAGASALVVGRPIIKSEDPFAAARDLSLALQMRKVEV